ncbi:hypothetical protein Poly21_11670 [Allorhodopirellula heiligendammensis]|uniref:Uncharacterized protein n=1 Tax=Allorhodopirellula heiligendammensis TaxID=2714739 RepID=A0A5C6C6B5_9BACT|nr:hypothetical protein Poly21_11670 [Allorhodopirellula heiligendammensis]
MHAHSFLSFALESNHSCISASVFGRSLPSDPFISRWALAPVVKTLRVCPDARRDYLCDTNQDGGSVQVAGVDGTES